MSYNTRSQKVHLGALRSLNFYAGETTKSRRNQPIAQLNCEGKACKRYQPDVIHCESNTAKGVTEVG